MKTLSDEASASKKNMLMTVQLITPLLKILKIKIIVKKKLTIIHSVVLNREPTTNTKVANREIVDYGLDNKSKSVVRILKDNDSNSFMLTNIDSFFLSRDPTTDNEASNKKFVVDDKGNGTIVRFNVFF